MHGENRGIEDVYLIDFLWCDHTHRPRHSVALYGVAEDIAPLLAELFRIVEVGVDIVWREDDGGSKYRSSEASPSCLVAARLYQTSMIVVYQHANILLTRLMP